MNDTEKAVKAAVSNIKIDNRKPTSAELKEIKDALNAKRDQSFIKSIYEKVKNGSGRSENGSK